MKFRVSKLPLAFLFFWLFQISVQAATKVASLKINDKVAYQKITGFGGFVNSATFAYNYMTTKEIQRLWGKNSEAGYTIMRMYLPIGESAWPQSLATALLAKSLGVKLFASPWSMPAEWKTNNNTAAVYTDPNGVVQEGSLKEEYYDDYAQYLNNYVTYLRNNGVELDAISIQNEPDMKATYAGCLWTPAQMAKFLKEDAPLIHCKIIAPESVGITDNYATALSADSVQAKFDIFAGHQYGNIQSGMKALQTKGKEVWMTEYLINWNADENTTRNFNWSKDAFSFANKLNDALLANVNAWVHYASKRFYGLMGDGTNGTVTGAMTKRGYIQSHFAKYATGTTRIDQTWSDDSQQLKGSTYQSVTGDSIIVMLINSSADSYALTIDLPFYTLSGKSVTTTETLNMSGAALSYDVETFRPKVTVAASSFTTFLFTKSKARPESNMSGQGFHPNKLDNQVPSSGSFGTGYKLSGKTVVFDHANSLISANTASSSGYLMLDDQYNQLVFHVNSVSSSLSYTSANTTLYYINGSGSAASYNYGTVTFNSNGNYDWVLDISRNVLTDGCKGILGIGNSNYSSILTLSFGDVYLKFGTEKLYAFSGIYCSSDSRLLDCLEDSTYTSLDFTATDSLPADVDWNAHAFSKNGLYFLGSNQINPHVNVVIGSTCNQLSLTEGSANFYVPVKFNALSANFTKSLNGTETLVLPFQAIIPDGCRAYSLTYSPTEVTCTQISNGIIPANTPVLVEGTGVFNFVGSGTVSTPHAPNLTGVRSVYVSSLAPANSYVLKNVGGTTAFYRVTKDSEPVLQPFSAYVSFATVNSATSLPLRFVLTDTKTIQRTRQELDWSKPFYDLSGRRVWTPKKGLYIQEGKKVVF